MFFAKVDLPTPYHKDNHKIQMDSMDYIMSIKGIEGTCVQIEDKYRSANY